MKNLFIKLVILGIVSSSLAFIGCKKDDDSGKNQIIFESTDYNLVQGYKNSEGDSRFDVMLLGTGMIYDSEDLNFNGKGSFLYLSMYSIDDESLSPGLYTFDRFAPLVLLHDSLTIDEGIIGINTIFDFGFPEDTLSIASGVVDVKKRGNLYEFNFDFYTTANVQLKGLYSGTLEDFTINYGVGVGNFTLQGKGYALNHGQLDFYETNDDNDYIYDLEFTGPGTDELFGGNKLSVNICSSVYNGLKAGRYTFADDLVDNTFDAGFWENEYEVEDYTSDVWHGFVQSGTIDILRDGRKYTIDYDLMVSNSIIGLKPLKGQYIGYLDLIK